MPRQVDAAVQERRERRRSNTGISGGIDPSNAPPGGFGSNVSPPNSGGGGGFDRNSGAARTAETGEVIPPSHFNSRLEWQEYYAGLPQEIKAGHKQRAAGRENQRNNYLSFGGDFNTLGIKNKKEEGQAAYRRMGMHNLDKSYSYDWANGVKYNVATSDDNVYMKPIPLTPDDYAEKAEIDKYGATPEGFARRMQDSTRNTLNKWAGQNAGTGKITRGPDGRLQAIGESGQTIYFDDYGNALDASGNSTGINYATGGWGSLAGVGVVPGGANPNQTIDPGGISGVGGDWARQVAKKNPNYSGWGNTYGPGTSGSGLTIPVGTTTTPPVTTPSPVKPIGAPGGFGSGMSPTTGMNVNQPITRQPSQINQAPQSAANPFSAPGSMNTQTKLKPRAQSVRPMGFGAY